MSKHRDIWLFLDSAVEYKHFGPQRVEQLGDRQIHLIEKQSYLDLQARAEKLVDALELHGHDNRYNPSCEVCVALKNWQEWKEGEL